MSVSDLVMVVVDFVFEKIVPIVSFMIIMGVLIGLCVLLGDLIAFTCIVWEQGPWAVLGWGATVAFLVAIMSAVYVCGGDSMSWCQAIVAGAIPAISILVMPIRLIVDGHREADYHRQLATKVQVFALQHFDEIDADADGIITDIEVKNSQHAKSPVSEVQDLIDYLKLHCKDIGHAMGSHTTFITTFIRVSKITIPQTRPIIYHDYGINRDDLNAYPKRVAKKYVKW